MRQYCCYLNVGIFPILHFYMFPKNRENYFGIETRDSDIFAQMILITINQNHFSTPTLNGHKDLRDLIKSWNLSYLPTLGDMRFK